MVASDRISAYDFVLDTTDPRQGRDPHPDVAVVVRPARRPGARTTCSPPTCPSQVQGPRGRVRGAGDVPRRVRRPRLPHRLGTARLPVDRRGLRHRAARAAWSTAAGCPSRCSPRPPRRRWATTTRTSPSRRWSATSAPDVAARAARPDPGGLRPRRAARPGARHHPGRHQVRVRHAARPSDGPVGESCSADEVLTPDSSRYWPADEWQPGRTQASYDKQIVRNWLTSPASGWDRASGDRPPPLPDEIVERTRGALRRGLRAAHRRDVLMARADAHHDSAVRRPGGRRPSPTSPTRATGRSGSPRCGRVELLDERRAARRDALARPHRGRGWSPEMEITALEPDVLWAESGRWRAIEADLTLRLRAAPRRVQRGRRRSEVTRPRLPAAGRLGRHRPPACSPVRGRRTPRRPASSRAPGGG